MIFLWGKCELLLWRRKWKGRRIVRKWGVKVTLREGAEAYLSHYIHALHQCPQLVHATHPLSLHKLLPLLHSKASHKSLPACIRGSRFLYHSVLLGITPNLLKQHSEITSSNLWFYCFPAMIIFLHNIWKPVTGICNCNPNMPSNKQKNPVLG